MKRHSQQVKDKALELWKSGKELEEISKELSLSFGTVHSWYKRGKWSKERKEQKIINAQKLTQKVAEKNADKEIKVLEKARKLQEKLNPLLETTEEDSKPIEKIAAARALTELYKLEGKITGELVEKTKHEGDINLKVIPIFGDVKLNVHSNNSNEKTTNSG